MTPCLAPPEADRSRTLIAPAAGSRGSVVMERFVCAAAEGIGQARQRRPVRAPWAPGSKPGVIDPVSDALEIGRQGRSPARHA